ncbi:MAG TPA: hypothetical protein VIE64_05890 [Solirubrobacterales bacterium]
MKRWLLGGALAIAVIGAVYLLFLRTATAEPRLVAASPTSVIGEGEEAVGVTAEGTALIWLPPPEEGSLPSLPLSAVPEEGRLAGPALQQARVLGAAPAVLRSCIAGSYFGESGVDVELRSGIELRFGDASRAAEKWRSAATILADPAITALDYVDLHSPRHPSIGGVSHALPPASPGSDAGCGG